MDLSGKNILFAGFFKIDKFLWNKKSPLVSGGFAF